MLSLAASAGGWGKSGKAGGNDEEDNDTTEFPQASLEEKFPGDGGGSAAQCLPASFSSIPLLPQPLNQYILNLI